MKKNVLISIFFILIVSLIPLIWKTSNVKNKGNQQTGVTSDKSSNDPSGSCRIVSLAPSLTEIVFALGAGHKLVGVTRFCTYPGETKNIPKVGGYYDPNYEAIINTKPDLVLLLNEHEQIHTNLEKMNIRTLAVDHKHISGIIKSIPLIGKACGSYKQAQELVHSINKQLKYVTDRVKHHDKPRCLLIVDRDRQRKWIEDVYVSCAGSFYEEIINYAGGQNTCSMDIIEYPKVSAEGILHMNPDIIIEMVGSGVTLPESEILNKQWASIPQISAVKNDRIYYFTQDYAVIPGPRFVQIVADCARLFHPDIDW